MFFSAIFELLRQYLIMANYLNRSLEAVGSIN
jgi:hypothetical protein